MTGYDHHNIFPLGSDETIYRKLDINGGLDASINGTEILVIDPTVIVELSAESASRTSTISYVRRT